MNGDRDFACWLPEFGEIRKVSAPSHQVAAVRFMHFDLADGDDLSNPPDPSEVCVVDIDTGESQFICVVLTSSVWPRNSDRLREALDAEETAR